MMNFAVSEVPSVYRRQAVSSGNPWGGGLSRPAVGVETYRGKRKKTAETGGFHVPVFRHWPWQQKQGMGCAGFRHKVLLHGGRYICGLPHISDQKGEYIKT